MNDIVEGGVAPADHAWSLPESWSRRISSSRLVVMALAVALAAWAQQLTDHRASVGLTLACYGAAALLYALFAPALGREPEKATTPHTRIRFHAVSGTTEHESGAPPTDSRRRGRRRSYLRVRSGYLLWAVVFAALSFASLGGNRFNGQGIVPWILGMAFCFLALPGEAGERWGARGRRMLATLKLGRWRITWTTWGLILALALGAALRLYHLWELPSDLGWDLPYNYSDVQRILHGEYLVFFPDNYGREGMFFYLAAAVSRVEGASPFALRLTSALIGIATIPAIYALARECVDREMGVYAAILLAANKWHLVLTRSGYRVSLMPRARPAPWASSGLGLGGPVPGAGTIHLQSFHLCSAHRYRMRCGFSAPLPAQANARRTGAGHRGTDDVEGGRCQGPRSGDRADDAGGGGRVGAPAALYRGLAPGLYGTGVAGRAPGERIIEWAGDIVVAEHDTQHRGQRADVQL